MGLPVRSCKCLKISCYSFDLMASWNVRVLFDNLVLHETGGVCEVDFKRAFGIFSSPRLGSCRRWGFNCGIYLLRVRI